MLVAPGALEPFFGLANISEGGDRKRMQKEEEMQRGGIVAGGSLGFL